MIFETFELEGTNQKELNTELRFSVASARADGRELIKLMAKAPLEPREEDRLRSCILRVLRTMRNDNVFQFFLFDGELSTESTESEYLKNKYSEFLTDSETGYVSVYLKL